MENNNKLFKIIAYSLLGLSAIMTFYFFIATEFDLSPNGNVSTTSGVMLNYTYALAIIATLTALVFSVVGMAKNPANAKNALIVVASLVIICGVGYAMAGDEVHIDYEGVLLADEGASQKSEAGLIATYILLAGAIGSIVFAEVSKMLK